MNTAKRCFKNRLTRLSDNVIIRVRAKGDTMDKQEYNKQYYAKNKVLKNGTIREKRNAVKEYKRLNGCKKCGYDESGVALDFHHRKRESKSYSVSQMLRLSIKELKKEMRKCDILCANCHRLEHYRKIA